MSLEDAEIDRVADQLIERIHAQKHEFWVDPESHYQDHRRIRKLEDDDIHTLRDLINAYKNARTLFWRAFLGLAIIGSIVLAAVGMGFKG